MKAVDEYFPDPAGARPMTLADELKAGSVEIDLGILHHFAGGVYAKEMHLPKGHYAIGHAHEYAHLSVLAAGIANVETDDVWKRYTAPAVIVIPAGVVHRITAIQDVMWLCIHATDETDPDKVDDVLIKKGG